MLEGRAYRLPTEAQWEYAARAGTTTRFFFGDALECPDDARPEPIGTLPQDSQCPAALPYWQFDFCDCCHARPGLKLPNPWGFYDMPGLMCELCRDWYGPYPPGPVWDPVGPPSGMRRVVRDLNWDLLRLSRSAQRGSVQPTLANGGNFSFRIVMRGCPSPYDTW